jgi:cell division protein FtsZ
MEDSVEEEVKMDVHRNEDDYYEDLIRGLYKPAVKKTPTMAQAIVQELPFEVDSAPDPEPAVVTDPEPEEDEEQEEPTEPTILDKWKKWLTDLMNVVTE